MCSMLCSMAVFVKRYKARVKCRFLIVVTIALGILFGINFLMIKTDCSVPILSREHAAVKTGDIRIGRAPSVTPPSTNHTKVIILSYMRSGTSMLGQIFDSNPRTTYVFEPLWSACDRSVSGYIDLVYLNGTKRRPPQTCAEIGVHILQSYLTCDIESVDIDTLSSRFHLDQGVKTRDFARCGLRRPCVVRFSHVCRSSHIRVVKTIRLRLKELKPLMERYHNLKVIHLVRDPRGVIQSRINVHEYYAKNPIISATNICGDMRRDAETLKVFNVLFPGRVFHLRYEDFCAEPFKYARNIYEFLNETFPNSTRQWISKNMFGNGSIGRSDFGTTGIDASKRSYKWRSQISWNLVSAMNEPCRQTFDELLYTHASTNGNLRNLSVPMRREMCVEEGAVMVCPRH